MHTKLLLYMCTYCFFDKIYSVVNLKKRRKKKKKKEKSFCNDRKSKSLSKRKILPHQILLTRHNYRICTIVKLQSIRFNNNQTKTKREQE